MTTISDLYATGYFLAAFPAVVSIYIRLSRPLTNGERLLSSALLLPLLVAYFLGMYRSDGIDFYTYSVAYNETGQEIPDPGYTALTWLTFRLGIDFSTFLVLQGVFTLTALWIVSEAKKSDALVVIAIYLLHLAIVRDMAQSRIGLAAAIYLIGQTRKRNSSKLALYAAAASIHITIVIMMFAWTIATASMRWRRLNQIVFIYAPLAALAIGGVSLISMLSFIDPRIEIYLSWDEPGYGAPLESFGALVRTILVIFLYLAAMRRFKNMNLQDYITSELIAAAILIGFAQYSIFAARLSNVAISMYPIGIGIIARAYQQMPMERNRRITDSALKCAIAAVAAVLILRPGSLDALQQVVPKILVLANELD